MNANHKKLQSLLKQAKSADVSAARQLLGISAGYLKSRIAIPDELADFIAEAFSRASINDFEDRRCVQELAFNLGLVRNDGRPKKKIPSGELALAIAVYGDNLGSTAFREVVAQAYGAMTTNTAKAHINSAIERIEEGRRVLGKIPKSKREF